MKKFLVNIFYIAVVISLLIGLIIQGKISIYKKFNYSIDAHTHILFTGASLLEVAMNDSLISGSLNICRSSEPHLYTYIKLKYLLRDNPQIDTIFVGIGPANLNEHTDYRYFNPNQAPSFISSFYPLFTKEEWSLFFSKEPNFFIKCMMDSFDEKIYYSGDSFLKNFGKFLKSEKEFNRNQIREYTDFDFLYGNSINVMYLKKIRNLCDTYGVKLYCVYPPVFKEVDFFNEKNFYKTYKEHFSDIELLDYSEYKIADSLRQDQDHLNYKGSLQFTKEIKNRFGFE